MSAVDSPTEFEWPPQALRPQRFGHFVLFRFDNLASVAIFDEEASRVAALLPRDWYLGLVAMPGPFRRYNAAGTQLLSLQVHLIGVGPADPVSACSPISPAPQLTEDHPPVQLPVALPWPNLYVHSYHIINAVITRIHYGAKYFPASLTDDQQRALLKRVSMDRYDKQHATRELARNAAAAEAAAAASEQSSLDDEGSHVESDYDSEGTGSDDFRYSDEAQMLKATLSTRCIYGEVWLDPSACPDLLKDPAASEEVLRKLHEIATDWFERKLEEARAKRPQLTREWIQAVENASKGSVKEHIADDDIRVPLDDDAVLPQDSVDCRIEDDDSDSSELGYIRPRTSFEARARLDSVMIVIAPKVHDHASHPAAVVEQDSGEQLQVSPPSAIAPQQEIVPPTFDHDPGDTKHPDNQDSAQDTIVASPPIASGLTQSKPGKESTRAVNWLGSLKRSALTSFRSTFAHIKARTPRVTVNVSVRRQERAPEAHA